MNNLDLPLDGTIKYDIVCLHKIDQHQYDMPFHRHTVYELELYISGDINLITDKSTYHMQNGYLTLVPPGVWHRTTTVDTSIPYERIVLNIKPSIIDSISTAQTNLAQCFFKDGPTNIQVLKLDSTQMTRYIKFCHQLIPIINSTEFGTDIRRRNLLAEIMLITNDAARSKQASLKNIIPPLIKRITAYVDANIANDLTLAAFSKYFFLNPSYISRYFKSYMGLSLHAYIIEKRIELAKTLLSQGNSVSDTCSLSGFGNYSNFIRTFNRHVGVSPGHYVQKQE